MITIKDYMELIEYRITEGSRYCWDCFGPNAYMLDSWTGPDTNDGYTISITFDTTDQTVYQIEAFDYKNDRAYRLTHPDYVKAHREEAQRRSVDIDQAWDEVKFVDLEVEEDFLEKARAIIEGRDYDTRVRVPIEFTDDELLKYMTLAHERDMTFNQFVEEALRQMIDEFHRDPEAVKRRFKEWKHDIEPHGY